MSTQGCGVVAASATGGFCTWQSAFREWDDVRFPPLNADGSGLPQDPDASRQLVSGILSESCGRGWGATVM